MTDTSTIEVTENVKNSRFEVSMNGQVVGYAFYEVSNSRVVFTHTEVAAEAGGHGIGGALAHAALDTVRATGRQAIPRCPFISSYISKHPEYLDLVPESFRDQVPPAPA